MSCNYRSTGTFCSHKCAPCDTRMLARQVAAKRAERIETFNDGRALRTGFATTRG